MAHFTDLGTQMAHSRRTELLLATRNPPKLAELRRILAAAGGNLTVLGLDDVAPYDEPSEDGATFEENALIKARAAVAATGLPALADDSGLTVDALGGMPGVLSARWSGRHGDDRANLDLVLAQVAAVPDERRGARFVCAVALVRPDGAEHVLRAVWHGTLARAPRGSNGFGYDPIFVPLGERRTSAELSAAEKDAVSHRGQALRAMLPELLALAG
jgi:XTP/dITP diphosphohydrolase